MTDAFKELQVQGAHYLIDNERAKLRMDTILHSVMIEP
jgi:hypothetical protein